MASKLSDQPITQADLQKFIRTQDDFALELYAYSLAREIGFVATHSGSYKDRVTGKTRQFDVRASKSCSSTLRVYFAIECKSLRLSFPLLVSQTPRLASEGFQDIVRSPGTSMTPSGPIVAFAHLLERLDCESSLYQPNQYVGKALTQVGLSEAGSFVSNDYEVFEKWGQAIASANGLIHEAAHLDDGAGMSQRSIVLPVLVVPDETLWVANYSENGVLQEGPVQKDEVEFYIGDTQRFDQTRREFSITHLHIVTKTGLDLLLRRFAEGGSDATRLSEEVEIHLASPKSLLDQSGKHC